MAKINTIFGLTDNVSSPLEQINKTVNKTQKGFSTLASKIFNANQAIQLFQGVSKVFKGVSGQVTDMTSSYQYQAEQELKLTTIMRQRMGANKGMIQSIKDLASAEQKRGIYGDEMILQGAQELASFTQTEGALKTLIPAMNDLIAQQYGYKASGMDFQHTADMMGKVLSGQTGALSRMGYIFSEEEKQLLKTGDEMQRAATLAKIITDNVGHMNQALAGTDTGNIQNVRNQLGDLKEQVGQILQPLQVAINQFRGQSMVRLYNAIIPVLQKIVNKSIFIIDYISRHMETIIATANMIKNGILAVVNTIMGIVGPIVSFIINNLDVIISVSIGLFTTYITYLAIMKAKSIATAIAMFASWAYANTPFLLMILAITAVISILGILAVKVKGVAEFIGKAFGAVYAVIMNIVNGIYNAIVWIINKFADISEKFGNKNAFRLEAREYKDIQESMQIGGEMGANVRDKIVSGTEKIQKVIDELKKGNLSSLQAKSMIDDISDTLDNGVVSVADKSTVNIAEDYQDLLARKASMSFGAHLETALSAKTQKAEVPQINITGVTISSDVDAENFFQELAQRFKIVVDSTLR